MDYNNYLEVATPRELEYIEALKKSKNEASAAKKLGISETTLKRGLRRVKEKATIRGLDLPKGIQKPPEGCDISSFRYNTEANEWLPVFAKPDPEAETDITNVIDHDFIEGVVKKHIKTQKITKTKQKVTDTFDRLIFTDVHVGMSTDGGRNVVPLYDNTWNAEELHRRGSKIVSHVLKYKKSDLLIIDDLGDFCDGLEGKTTRKGHDLPQNMNDKEAFENGVKFKIDMLDKLSQKYHQITVNCVCESNHGGIMEYFVNSLVAKMAEIKYDNVQVNVLERFISHYSIGQHTFILSHGKDSESLKFGFKPVMDHKCEAKIDHYCTEYNLYNGNYIEFSKGDSHQYITDFTSSNKFDYCSYPATSPASNWVATNFKNTISGIVFQTIEKSANIKTTTPYFFE